MNSLKFLLVFSIFSLLSSCDNNFFLNSKKKFNNIDITGANYAKNFSLIDHNGVKRNLSDFKNKIVIVFFGFTNCPDICPSTLFDLAKVKKLLGWSPKVYPEEGIKATLTELLK